MRGARQVLSSQRRENKEGILLTQQDRSESQKPPFPNKVTLPTRSRLITAAFLGRDGVRLVPRVLVAFIEVRGTGLV
jgi:hypothetical protein